MRLRHAVYDVMRTSSPGAKLLPQQVHLFPRFLSFCLCPRRNKADLLTNTFSGEKMILKAEYVWIDGHEPWGLRSKVKVISNFAERRLGQRPQW